jgi:hypothetical protein
VTKKGKQDKRRIRIRSRKRRGGKEEEFENSIWSSRMKKGRREVR